MTIQEAFKTMDYAPAPESRKNADAWLDSHNRSMRLFIDGEWMKSTSDKTIPAYAPATGEKLADISVASTADVDRAVAAARAAQPKWVALGGHGRARFLYSLSRLLQKHSRILSVIESLDNGKPIRESRDLDIPLAARHFYHHAGWAQILNREFPHHEALGVAGQIIPWNFPLLMLAWKVAPALAAGNTVVLKPAEFTSLSALKFAELCIEAGLPKGVFNIVTGAGEVGAEVVKADVDKIAFTGSTEVGKIIRRTTAGSGKKLTLELGGKSPFLVFEDADIDGAIEGLVDAIWFNQGQVCCAGSRLLVQEGVADRFFEKLKVRMGKLRVGNSLDKCIDIGAVIDQVQKDKVESLLVEGEKAGAKIWRAECELPPEGLFLAPTLVTGVGTDNILVREEIFGPVVTAMTFRTQAEGIQLANNTVYGLAATVWSESLSKALEVAPLLKAGVVWINGTNMFDAAVGFGGYRESGFGREGGREGMLAYLKPKYEKKLKTWSPVPVPERATASAGGFGMPGIDQTAKMYIGGKQTRPDGGDSIAVLSKKGVFAGLVGEGNRKDIRNAVEAADKAKGWSVQTTHLRAQILFYIAENLSYRSAEFAKRLESLTGVSAKKAEDEVQRSIERLFAAAAYSDKYEGSVHTPPLRGVALAMKEAVGAIGIACPDEAPLLAFVTLISHAIAMGNTTVVIPSERYPLIATDFYQILETSDLPAGVVNIVTGSRDNLTIELAKHYGIEAIWHFGSLETSAEIEKLSADNMKRTWLSYGKAYDWFDEEQMASDLILEKAVEIKNIWVPYGDMTSSGRVY